MTKEEAESLQPGDVIEGPFFKQRTITGSHVENNSLRWSEALSAPDKHTHNWKFEDISLVHKKDPIINNYELY